MRVTCVKPISRVGILFLLACLLAFLPLGSRGQEVAEKNKIYNPPPESHLVGPKVDYFEAGIEVAPVLLDGELLFRMRGVSAVPATYRAKKARENILAIAGDASIDSTDVSVTLVEDHYVIEIGGRHVVNLFPADADLEGIPLKLLANTIGERLKDAINLWRNDRSAENITRKLGLFAGITGLAVLLIGLVVVLFGWLDRVIQKQVGTHLEKIERASHAVIRSGQVWKLLGAVVRTSRAMIIIVLSLVWLNSALALFPWTRAFSRGVFQLVIQPLTQIGMALLNFLPNFIFLIILWFLLRFVLRAIRTFFDRVHRGWIHLANFDQDWALPTYRITRIVIIAFGLVVAYPYIPGSESAAFKGLSIFFGILLSIGSSSFIANIVAGYSLTYRGAFHPGDRVKIGDFVGEIIELKTQSTRLRTLKNEHVNIPNSALINSPVVNYTTLQGQDSLILHTEVGIGYDTPWRQIEAMLLMAANRTDGLEQEPPPFVLKLSLGDFSVVYQLNAYCGDAPRMQILYSSLHANILDVFNEYGVQIMSPNYKADPMSPKIVPTDRWFASPAVGPTEKEE